MLDLDAFGRPRAPGGEQDVGEPVPARRARVREARAAIRRLGGHRNRRGGGVSLDVNEFNGIGQVSCVVQARTELLEQQSVTEYEPAFGAIDHAPGSLGRIFRVEWHVAPAGPEDPEQRGEEVGCPFHQHPDGLLRA